MTHTTPRGYQMRVPDEDELEHSDFTRRENVRWPVVVLGFALVVAVGLMLPLLRWLIIAMRGW